MFITMNKNKLSILSKTKKENIARDKAYSFLIQTLYNEHLFFICDF